MESKELDQLIHKIEYTSQYLLPEQKDLPFQQFQMAIRAAQESAIRSFVTAEVERAIKAFGGCRKCYGKGYATVRLQNGGHATDGDIGGPEGAWKSAPRIDMKFCACERGEQLSKLLQPQPKKGQE